MEPMRYIRFVVGAFLLVCSAQVSAACIDTSAEGLFGKFPVLKSEVVTKIAQTLQTQGVAIPPSSSTVRFYDLDAPEKHYPYAQFLRALGILSVNGGYFGNGKIPNPNLPRSEVEYLLDLSFANNCGDPAIDPDQDGITRGRDLCPLIPSPNTVNGCPSISLPIISPTVRPRVVVKPQNTWLGIQFFEEDQIRIGDKFRSIIRDKETNQVWAESKEIEVKN